MRVEINRAIVIYGVGYASTSILLIPFFYNKSSGFIKALMNSMTSIHSILWPVALPRITVDFMLLPIFQFLYYNRSLR